VAAYCHKYSVAWIYEYGVMESANPKETFSLKSMVAASAWCGDQKWEILSYNIGENGDFVEKASDVITAGQTAQKINFAKLGHGFSNISAVAFSVVSLGSPGNSCTYGTAEYGVALAFDELKVHWNGKIPGRHLEFANGPRPHAPHVIASPAAMQARQDALPGHSEVHNHSGGGAAQNGGTWHSQLTSLDVALGHGGGGGLTAQFALPQPEHFGT
jgi:hypothetical protein